MKLEQIIAELDVGSVAGSRDIEIEGIAYDSRRVRSGYLFVAVHGHQVDGTQFITDAVANGAAAVVSENKLDLGVGCAHVQVPCARRALAEIATVYYGDPSRMLDVIGITGTNGKTTTAHMIRDLLRAAGRKPGMIGTVAYEIGERIIPASRTTPEAPEIHSMFQQMKETGCDSVVMEVSSHALALQRVHGINFKIGVFTNLTQDHLDFHGDIESYFKVKAGFFQGLEKAVVNIDDPWGRQLADRQGMLAYGFDEQATVRASKASVSESGCRFRVDSPWNTVQVRLQLLGRFNIHNALAAFAAGGLLGIDPQLMAKALAEIQRIPGRLELIPNRKKKKVFVDYAHTDDALKNVLGTLREITKGRLVVVFGCGGNRDRGKRLLMGRVAAELADYSIITSDNPRGEEPAVIASNIVDGFASEDRYEIILDRYKAIAEGIAIIGRHDVLLVAGKGHETLQEFNDTTMPFDDRETVRELIG